LHALNRLADPDSHKCELPDPDPDSHYCELPDPDPDFKKVNFIILIILFEIFVRKYGNTSKITRRLHLVEIDKDPDPA
jgi:hypothetical protein